VKKGDRLYFPPSVNAGIQKKNVPPHDSRLPRRFAMTIRVLAMTNTLTLPSPLKGEGMKAITIY